MSGISENKRDIERFFELVRRRMETGEQQYGDRSWSRDPVELCDEVAEEILDICGWSVIAWCRLERAKRAMIEFANPAKAAE